jgi:hypothetical protein
MKKTMVCAVAALAAGGVMATAVSANAQALPACSSLGNKNPVYIAGSSASKPIWAALGGKVPGIDIIYQGPSSCQGLSEATTGAKDASSATFYDGSAAGVACDPLSVGPVTIGVSDVFATSCPGGSVPSGYADFTGPIQVMTMVVPYTSTASSISYDAAYAVFGWGGTQYAVTPWTSLSQIWVRTPSSGTETMIGAAIGLNPSKWLSQAPDGGASQQIGKSGDLLKDVLNAGQGSTPNEVIGILAADLADTHRGAANVTDAGITGGLKILAFQAKNQTCGYLPDSDATHYDKINVRQGRYDIWGPLHLVTAVDASNKPTSAGAAAILKYLTLDSSLATTDMQTVIQADANAFVIPQCAMQVSRSVEVAVDNPGMASYQPTLGCGCYYESLKNGGQGYSKYCTTCTAATDCKNSAYPKCNFGFCEAQ